MSNKNSVELIDFMGGDNLHSLAAWSSTFLEFDIDIPENIENRVDVLVNHILNNGKKKRKVEDLLEYLASNQHTSPFRFSSFVFGMTTDIATHIQKLKHKVILEAENGESARYKELKEDKIYLPEDWKGCLLSQESLAQSNGIYGLNATWLTALEDYSILGNKLYHRCLEDLTPILGRKRAKESARYFKTMNSQITLSVMMNMSCFYNFYSLRADDAAQIEIQDIANQMLECIKTIPNNPFKHTLNAFNL